MNKDLMTQIDSIVGGNLKDITIKFNGEELIITAHKKRGRRMTLITPEQKAEAKQKKIEYYRQRRQDPETKERLKIYEKNRRETRKLNINTDKSQICV